MTNALTTLKRSLLDHEWSFPYNCYEVGHAWTSSCTEAAIDVGWAAFKGSFPLYLSLYLFSQLAVQRRYDKQAFMETLRSILTSSSFLGFHFFSGIIVSCILRNSSDRYYFRIMSFWPGFISAAISILIERESRRPALAFYLVNMSSELLFRLLVDRGYMVSVKHGETLLFTLGLSGWFYFLRLHGFGHDPVSLAFKLLVGPQEAKSRSRQQKAIENRDEHIKITTSGVNESNSHSSNSIRADITQFLNKFFDRHSTCPHKHSCFEYSLDPFFSRFLIGWTFRSVLNLAGAHRNLMKHPADTIWKSFMNDRSIKFGLFLGSLVSLGRSAYCILRRHSGRQENWHGLVAGAAAGSSMLFAPRSSIATYVVWKCLEQFYFQAVKEGRVKYVTETVVFAYSISVALLLYTFALEPRFIRPSYMKFLDKISDHRLHQLNRLVLDVFGTGASVGYEDWFPNLDPKFMTRQFQEIVFNWMIQPY